MSAQTKPSDTITSAHVQAGDDGSYLLWARLIWVAVTLLSLVVFIASMQLARTVDLFTQMPYLAAELDVALFSIFANNQLLASNAVLFGAAVQFLAFSGIGLFLFWRKSSDWLAILISAMLISIGAGMSPGVFFLPILRPVWHLPASLLQSILFSALLLFLYLFPNGRFVPSWTRLAALLWGLYALCWLIWPQLNPHRAGNFAALLIFIAWSWTGIVAQIQRYRRNDGIEHQQQKWVLIGVFFTHLFFGSLVLTSATGLNQQMMAVAPFPTKLINTLFGFSALLIPISISLAILRYRLWDVDVWINHTVVYGGLTAVVLISYGLIVGLLSAIFQDGSSLFFSVLVTGLIAILFNPLRQRLQTWVNRLMYGERDDPVTVLSHLGKQLEETAVPGQTLVALTATIAQTLKLPYVAIEVADKVIAATGSADKSPVNQYPLTYQSQPLGQLLVAVRPGGRAFAPYEERLLRDVARQAGPAVYAERLTYQLQRSRERLVTTREEERRRLRRDLHDGLGPQLATLTVKLGAAQNLLRTDPDGADHLIDEVKAESQKAVKEIRRVVNDLRPSVLDQLGLLSALREFVAQIQAGSTQIKLHAPDKLPPLPAAVEVAAYRIVTEATTNAVRHAQARRCTICLEIDETLNLRIDDDGNGLAEKYQPGVGLSSMRERAVELGGSFGIQSKPGQGTQLAIQLPIAEDE